MNHHLRLDRLQLRNFRCFAECTIDLHPQLTVFVAENGCGKTAVLDALANALILFVDTITDTRPLGGFKREDVRLIVGENNAMTPALPTEFEAHGYIAGRELQWSRSLQGYGERNRTSFKDAKNLIAVARQLRNMLANSAALDERSLAPLIAFYGTDRMWREAPLSRTQHGAFHRQSGYFDCLSSTSGYQGLFEWYATSMAKLGDPRFATQQATALAQVTAVNEAIRLVLAPTGWRDLAWDSEQETLVAAHPEHGNLRLSALSDGIRTMLSLVADVARRCAILNPHLGASAARETPGVLLIDEVDIHLHPRWQQVVVSSLRTAFPRLQIILSTHSPHTLSTVDKESIRVVELGDDGHASFRTPTMQTRGVESADVLASIMGVDPVPQVPEARKLSDYRALIEDGKAETPEALDMRAQLHAHFGASHPLLRQCDQLIRFQAFKLKRRSGV